MDMAVGRDSPCSMRSARTRSAKTSTFAITSSRVAPYTITPARSGTSAIQRPSSSCSISTENIGTLSCGQLLRRPHRPRVKAHRRRHVAPPRPAHRQLHGLFFGAGFGEVFVELVDERAGGPGGAVG